MEDTVCVQSVNTRHAFPDFVLNKTLANHLHKQNYCIELNGESVYWNDLFVRNCDIEAIENCQEEDIPWEIKTALDGDGIAHPSHCRVDILSRAFGEKKNNQKKCSLFVPKSKLVAIGKTKISLKKLFPKLCDEFGDQVLLKDILENKDDTFRNIEPYGNCGGDWIDAETNGDADLHDNLIESISKHLQSSNYLSTYRV